MESVQSKNCVRVVLVGEGDRPSNGCDSRTEHSNSDLVPIAVVTPWYSAGKAGECPDSVSKGGDLKVRFQSQRLDIGAPELPV